MTEDTVNVPREPTEAMIEAGYDETRLANGYPQFSDAGFCLSHARSIYRAMLAAAPKAEPVSDPYKLEAAKERVEKFLYEFSKMGGLDPEIIHGLHSGHETREANILASDLRALIDAIPPQHLSNPQQLLDGYEIGKREEPEAQKVEQEPDTLEAFTQSLAFGRMRLVSYDQCWTSKQATALLLSLLCAHPAPASDELLEAATALVGIVEGAGVLSHRKWNNEHGLRLKDTPEWIALYLAIAKHKGPQS